MKPLRLQVIVAALVAAMVCVTPAYADSRHYVTRENIEEGVRSNETRAGNFDPFWDAIRPIFVQLGLSRIVPSAGTNVVPVIAAGVLASIGIVFAWWGIRKVISMLFGAAWDGRFGAGIEARTKWWSATGKWRY